MIDLHCHILPGIDDGPPTMADALDLGRLAVANGITTIVATPHVSWDYPGNTAARIAAKVTEVNAALRDAGIALEVLPGAEVAMTRALELDPGELEALRLGGGPYLLVEGAMTPSGLGWDYTLGTLRARGHRIVLAHPERLPAFRRDREMLVRLIEDGMVAQLTAASLTGRFGKEVQAFSKALMADGLVHNVASDAHSTGRRAPSIAAELEAAGLGAHAHRLADEVPRAVLSGAPLPEAPRAAKRRRLFGGRR